MQKALLNLLLCSFLATVPAAYAEQLPLQSSATALHSSQGLCPQVSPLIPSKHAKLDGILDHLHNQPAFRQRAIEALGGAVRIPTESYDDLGLVGEDPRWDVFADLHAYLESTFARVYQTLKVTKINTYGLVFHWQGSDATLVPVLITAHQDVIPVEPNTIDQWVQPPYSGYYDGVWIWGRGAVDDKSDLISLLTSIDSMLQEGFKPTRTFVFAFGFDEETASSTQGAAYLHTYLENEYGTHSFAVLLDEGDGFETSSNGDLLAEPGTGEKGYLDVRIEVTTPGGHSSVPPPHTSIGILAAAIVALEAHPHPPSLIRNGTAFEALQCTAAHSPAMPDDVKELVRQAVTDDAALGQLTARLQREPAYAAVMATTQAVDVVRGGVKINALPEQAEALVNHRIAEHSSTKEVQDHITQVLLPVAQAYGLTLDAFGTDVPTDGGDGGRLVLSDAWGMSLEPAPKTPTVGSGPYDILAGTIRGALQQSTTWSGRNVIVTPMLALGNTDTRWYWNLTQHIFRYSHTSMDGIYGDIHTVNEAIRADAFIDKIRFHTRFILNWDEAAQP